MVRSQIPWCDGERRLNSLESYVYKNYINHIQKIRVLIYPFFINDLTTFWWIVKHEQSTFVVSEP